MQIMRPLGLYQEKVGSRLNVDLCEKMFRINSKMQTNGCTNHGLGPLKVEFREI